LCISRACDAASGSLVQQGFCVIFTCCQPSLKKLKPILLTRNCENPRLARHLRELAATAAPIPVTRLWTPRTRLKIRGLQTQSFH
jgi:hypothetical protein